MQYNFALAISESPFVNICFVPVQMICQPNFAWLAMLPFRKVTDSNIKVFVSQSVILSVHSGGRGTHGTITHAALMIQGHFPGPTQIQKCLLYMSTKTSTPFAMKPCLRNIVYSASI